MAIGLGAAFGIERIEWALVILSGAFVLALEAKNASIERTVDLSVDGYDYGAKGAKDAASGAVLLAALSSLAIGGLVFIPRLIALLASGGAR